MLKMMHFLLLQVLVHKTMRVMLAPFLFSLSGGLLWFPLVSLGYPWLLLVIPGYPWLILVIPGYPWLPHGHFIWPRLQKISAIDRKENCIYLNRR